MISAAQISRLEKLAELKRTGALTDEEFSQEKQKVMSGEIFVYPLSASQSPYDQPLDALEWMVRPLQRYADFSGRSQRKEYWMFTLASTCVGFIFGIMIAVSSTDGNQSVVGLIALSLLCIFFLAILIPSIAAQVRRLHDQNISGWFALLNLVPYIGGFVMLILMCVDGTHGPNRYGENPKQC